jgi:hypothetical protein
MKFALRRGAAIPATCAVASALLTFPPLAPAQREGAVGRVVDADGEVLPAGTVLRCAIAWVPRQRPPRHYPISLGCICEKPPPELTVGADGAFELPPGTWRPSGFDPWLLLEQTGTDGLRERAVTPLLVLPTEVRRISDVPRLSIERTGAGDHGARSAVPLRADVGTLVLRSEQRICAGPFVDESGAPPPYGQTQPFVRSGGEVTYGAPAPITRLAPRVVADGGRYELWGWPFDGELELHASYGIRGPEAEPVAIEPGNTELPVVLPNAGAVEIHWLLPDVFPERALFASVVDLESGATERSPLFTRDSSRLLLRTGCHLARVELHGVEVADLGVVEIERGRSIEAELDLRDRIRVATFDVVDAGGAPISAASVRVRGSADPRPSRQRLQVDGQSRQLFVVASAHDPIDVEVSDFRREFEPATVWDVRDGLVIMLRRAGR